MQFEIAFNLDNAAFDDCAQSYEIARILHELANGLDEGAYDLTYDKYRNVKDINGNIIGTWRIK